LRLFTRSGFTTTGTMRTVGGEELASGCGNAG
jgi:hypothetical protein